MRSFGTDAKAETIFESLRPIFGESSVSNLKDGEVSTNNLKNSAFFAAMAKASGGETFTL